MLIKHLVVITCVSVDNDLLVITKYYFNVGVCVFKLAYCSC